MVWKKEENINVFISKFISILPALAYSFVSYALYLILYKLLKREEAIIHFCKFAIL